MRRGGVGYIGIAGDLTKGFRFLLCARLAAAWQEVKVDAISLNRGTNRLKFLPAPLAARARIKPLLLPAPAGL